MLKELATKWRRETKSEPTFARLVKAEQFLKRRGLDSSQVRFEMHLDPLWNTRAIRDEHEREAVCIGYTNATKQGGRYARWWAVPKKNALPHR